MLEKGVFEHLYPQNIALSQAAAYSDMPQQHQMQPEAIAHAYDDQQTQE
jgi:hypothetical protein